MTHIVELRVRRQTWLAPQGHDSMDGGGRVMPGAITEASRTQYPVLQVCPTGIMVIKLDSGFRRNDDYSIYAPN